jgi:hypothetical protein
MERGWREDRCMYACRNISPLLIRIKEGMQRRFAKGLRGELMLLFCMREKRESDTIREGCIFT